MCALHVVLAPNAFKGTLTAGGAAEAMRLGVATVMPSAVTVMAPIADGGDGSVDAFVAAGFAREPVRVRDATGAWHTAAIAMLDGRAIVEVANTCGLALRHGDSHPLTSSTLGVGDAMRAALDLHTDHITVCLGGSASTDGGAGLLVALGARLLNAESEALVPSGSVLKKVAHIDLTGLDVRLRDVTIDVIADVESPLHGPNGAAHVFAPQKGASPEEVVLLDDALQHWARLLAEATGRDIAHLAGSGAAGGTAAALMAVFGAHVDSGAALLEALGLGAALADADLVITGEGQLDVSTLAGKGCAKVIELSRALGIPVIAVCGGVLLTSEDLRRLGVAGAWATDDPGPSAAASVSVATQAAFQAWLST